MNLKVPTPIRIAVLECDTPLPETKKRLKSYGGVFEVLLRAGAKALAAELGVKDDDEVESRLEISKYQVELEPERYPRPDEVDAVLITGSSEFLLLCLCLFAFVLWIALRG